MTDLERFAAALLTQWRAEGGSDGGPIVIGTMLDRVLPYRVARRQLGIDVSEDYEALALRLIAEEDGLVRVLPADAADMARATLKSKLPDLDVLKLLRSASVTLTHDAVARLDGVLPMPAQKDESKWAPDAVAATRAESAGGAPATESRPAARTGKARTAPPASPPPADVIPLRAASEPVAAKVAAEPPPEFLTTVSFTPPADERCWSCVEALPVGRQAKFCPYCGADQRQPQCTSCGGPVERRWKHCPDCGAKLWGA